MQAKNVGAAPEKSVDEGVNLRQFVSGQTATHKM
jgi:hypothetical protein